MLKPALLSLAVLVSALLLASISSAQNLPTFDDFRRVDRLRRATGQFQTAELLKVTQIDGGLIQRVSRQATNDYQVVWGAAELIDAWPIKREIFESAVMLSQSNREVVLRYACAAAQNYDTDTAMPLLHAAEKGDSDNIVPWFVELQLLSDPKAFGPDARKNWKAPPLRAMRYRDYAAGAARARIRTLEAAGYSAYSARRLGFVPDMPVLAMARACAEKPIDKSVAPMLLTMARAMQDKPIYLLAELVGESLERATIASGVDDPADNGASSRSAQLAERRDGIKALVSAMELKIVDLAAESEMIQYYDNVLSLGEEVAMHRLAGTIRGGQPLR